MRLHIRSALVGITFLTARPRHAAPIVLEGNYVTTAVSELGTLGSGDTAPPGILHDSTGTRNFGINAYLTPGNPHEIFAVQSHPTGPLVKNNHLYADPPHLTGLVHRTSRRSRSGLLL